MNNTFRMHKFLTGILAGWMMFFTTVNLVFAEKGTGGPAGRETEKPILTPRPGPEPRINGPLVYGSRPGNPFLYRIPCQGERPVQFSVKNLAPGLSLDPATGIITGRTPEKGEYKMLISAKNTKGTDKREFTLVSGETLALTPPMGWNHWYAHYSRITDEMMREAADVLISSGMADVGYEYVNIDDCWMNAPENPDPKRVGPLRDEQGNIVPNSYFPDMKGLTDYIHSKGLKAGIYTSPGPLTCAGFAGAYGYEEEDARQFAAWGFDFLKYDWCSYNRIALGIAPGEKKAPGADQKTIEVEQWQFPYRQMGDLLKKQPRDMVFNLCQYGRAEVWKWGAEVGGHCWRTAGDLGFELDRIFEVALKNAEHREYSKPGAWNDPDYIQIGWIGTARKQGVPELTAMPAHMQYAYMSLWCLMASPLIYSGDMSRLDEFTLNVLCNPEVIEVNQDPLGICGYVIHKGDKQFVMVKTLSDGSLAVGMFNRSLEPTEVTVGFDELKLTGRRKIRDLWRHADLGSFRESFTGKVPPQGVVMVKISKN